MYYKTDMCDLCSEKCREAYWIEITCESREKRDCFVCEECYLKLKENNQEADPTTKN